MCKEQLQYEGRVSMKALIGEELSQRHVCAQKMPVLIPLHSLLQACQHTQKDAGLWADHVSLSSK